jgi:hypothetical protein
MASMGEHSADPWLTCIDEWCRSTYNDFSVEEWRPFLKHATPKWINPSAQKPMMKPQMSFSISQIDIPHAQYGNSSAPSTWPFPTGENGGEPC